MLFCMCVMFTNCILIISNIQQEVLFLNVFYIFILKTIKWNVQNLPQNICQLHKKEIA